MSISRSESTPSLASLFAYWSARREQLKELDLDALLADAQAHSDELRALDEQWRAFHEHASSDLARRRASVVEERKADSTPSGELMRKLREHGPRDTRYAVLGEHARGGMGAIWKVWDEDLRRTLAMKVILGREEPDARSRVQLVEPRMLGRFLEEAQITGQLDHPGIVPVHELGLSSDGRVYFTMRFVKGQSLKDVFDLVHEHQEGWSQTRALGVMLKVCEALSYAHDKGVIHRDLKPANVMVGKYGEVYVMDWGLARVLEREDQHDLRIRPQPSLSETAIRTERLREREATPASPLVTMDGDVIGTPSYMPPEQAKGQLAQLGTRSDVYAVGAMLYHLLGGEIPFAPRGERVSQSEVLMRLVAGPPPSLTDFAPNTPPELIAICEKAMARDSTERYGDMREMADDLRAYLEQRVVRAYATGAWAETRKWVQRNKPLAGALAAAVLAIVVGGAAFAVKADEATRAATLAQSEAQRASASARAEAEQRQIADARRTEAEQARADSDARAKELQQVSDFQSSMLQNIDAELMGLRLREDVLKEARAAMERSKRGDEEIADRSEQIEELLAGTNFTNAAVSSLERNVLQPALDAINQDFAEQPLVQAQLLSAAGNALHSLGRYPAEQAARETALELRRNELGDEHADTLAAVNDLATLLLALGRVTDAEPLFRDALDRRRRLHGNLAAGTLTSLNNLAELLRDQGQLGAAETLLREAVDGCRATLGDDHPDTLRSVNNLASLLHAESKLSEAEPLLRDVLARRQRLLGEDHPDTLTSLVNLAGLLQEQGNLSDAELLFLDGLARRRRTLGDDHPDTLSSLNNLASVLQAQGKLEDAEPLFRGALARRRRILGTDHPLTIVLLHNVASLLYSRGKLSEAEAAFRDALAASRRTLGADHANVISCENNLALLLEDQGKLDEAESMLRDALERRRRTLGSDHLDTLASINNLAGLLRVRGGLGAAEELFRDALERYGRALGNDHPSTMTVLNNLAIVLKQQGRVAEAELLCRDALERRRSNLGNDHPDTLSSLNNLATLLHAQGKFAEAEPHFREALESRRRLLGDAHPSTLVSVSNLAGVLQDLGELANAEELYRDALERSRELFGGDYPNTITFMTNLAVLLQGQGKPTDAEPLFREALERSRRVFGDDHPDSIASVINLARLLQDQGRLGEAEPLRREVWERRRRILGDDHPQTLVSHMRLGSALRARDELPEAERLLVDCEERCVTVGAGTESTLKSTREELVKLYDSWETTAPGHGYSAKAAEYRAKLASVQDK